MQSFAEQTGKSQAPFEHEVGSLAGGEQLSVHQKVRLLGAALRQHVLCDWQRRRVAIIQTYAAKSLRSQPAVLRHVIPKEGVVLGRGTIAKFEAVRPGYQAPTHVH